MDAKTKKTVLFLCTGNSCRSQIAEGWLRHLAGDRFDVSSAGTHPVGLNPGAVEAMKEVGIDISQHRSKSVTELAACRFDYVITACDRAKETCPVLPGFPTTLHWSFEDPEAAKGTDIERRAVFHRVRDEIASHIRRFLGEESSVRA